MNIEVLHETMVKWGVGWGGGLPFCVLVSSQSRSASEGALGREYNDTCCCSGHSIATSLIFIHPKGIHSSGRYNYNRVMDMTIFT